MEALHLAELLVSISISWAARIRSSPLACIRDSTTAA
jgi:hypothetical protein